MIGIKKDIEEILELILDRDLSNKLKKMNEECREKLRKGWNEHKKVWNDYDEDSEHYEERYRKKVKENPDPETYDVRYYPPTKPWGRDMIRMRSM